MSLDQFIKWLAEQQEKAISADIQHKQAILSIVNLFKKNEVDAADMQLYIKFRAAVDAYQASKNPPIKTDADYKYIQLQRIQEGGKVSYHVNPELQQVLVSTHGFSPDEILTLESRQTYEETYKQIIKANNDTKNPDDFIRSLIDKLIALSKFQDVDSAILDALQPNKLLSVQLQRISDKAFRTSLRTIFDDEVSRLVEEAETREAKLREQQRQERLSALEKAVNKGILIDHLKNISSALGKADVDGSENIPSLIYWVYSLADYIGKTCFKDGIMELDRLSAYLTEVFGDFASDINIENEKLFFVLQRTIEASLDEIPEAEKSDKQTRDLNKLGFGLKAFLNLADPKAEKMQYADPVESENDPKSKQREQVKTAIADVETAILRPLLTERPIREVLPKVKELFPQKERYNSVKQKMQAYQVEHANEVFAAQLAIAAKKPEANLEKQHAEVAFEILKHIRDTIKTTDWELNLPAKIFGRRVTLDGVTVTVPEHMYSMCITIRNAFRNDTTGTKPEVWLKAFADVAYLGRHAAAHVPTAFLGYFGKRSEKTQQFYDRFTVMENDNRPRRSH